ncbi:hypothetical protein HZA86_04280 [Candidatus Uhrbacteria bacterium]|nr:hypothetical protein [Candidatus Uhrbacteria bacterium]
MTLYRDVFKTAWKITKQNPALWFFGLFAGPVINGGVFELLYQSLRLQRVNDGQWMNAAVETVSRFNLIDSVSTLMGRIGTITAEGRPSILLLTVLGLGALVLAWLIIISIDALISGTRHALKNEFPTIREGLKEGHTSFWSIAAVLVATVLLLSGLFLGIRASLTVPAQQFVVTVPIALLILAIMAVIAIVYFVAFYTILFVVMKRLGLRAALSQTVALLKQYWLVNIEMSAVLYVIALAGGVIGTFLIQLFAMLPLTYLLFSMAASGMFSPTVISVLGMLMDLLNNFLILALWGIISVFTVNSWTLLFTQLTKKSGFESKTERVVKAVQTLGSKPSNVLQ